MHATQRCSPPKTTLEASSSHQAPSMPHRLSTVVEASSKLQRHPSLFHKLLLLHHMVVPQPTPNREKTKKGETTMVVEAKSLILRSGISGRKKQCHHQHRWHFWPTASKRRRRSKPWRASLVYGGIGGVMVFSI